MEYKEYEDLKKIGKMVIVMGKPVWYFQMMKLR